MGSTDRRADDAKEIMTADPHSAPLPPSVHWVERRLTAEELATLRARLSNMTYQELMKFYNIALHMCQFSHGEPGRPVLIQLLIASWREIQRRRKVKYEDRAGEDPTRPVGTTPHASGITRVADCLLEAATSEREQKNWPGNIDRVL
jgi:hypothetical protein